MNESIKLYEGALAAFNRRDWRQTLELAARVVPQAPDHAGLHYIVGIAALELEMLPLAVRHLARAAQLEPGNGNYGAQHARALSLARLTRESVEAANRAMALSPQDPATLDTLGVVYDAAHDHALAATAFHRAISLSPPSAHLQFNLATALIATGELEGARSALETCLGLDPHYWRAHLTLAQLRRATPQDNRIQRLHALMPEAKDDLASMYVHLSLAKEYEDIGEYATAFSYLVTGKAAGGRSRRYAIKSDEALFDALMRAFPLPTEPQSGCPSDEPIFIIGMPRSGTTLVERIVSSHPDVYSAGELQNFGLILKRASGSTSPFLLDPLTVGRSRSLDWARVGQAYVESTQPATAGHKRFIDKLPHNFLYAGFIARALPKAKIICLRRHPMDTCLSNFRQLFALTAPYFNYSFDLLDTGRYYVLFDKLMAHWQRVLPGRVLEVSYEALVNDQEEQSRHIIEHCGLDWDDACLAFHNNTSPVSTASSVQVREPLNRRSLDRWRRYGAQLDPLAELLRSAGIDVE